MFQQISVNFQKTFQEIAVLKSIYIEFEDCYAATFESQKHPSDLFRFCKAASLRKKFRYLEFFWPVFSCIRIE